MDWPAAICALGAICAICKESIQPDRRFGYLEDKAFHPTCERCHAALMNLILAQKLGRCKGGDPRKILKRELDLAQEARNLSKTGSHPVN